MSRRAYIRTRWPHHRKVAGLFLLRRAWYVARMNTPRSFLSLQNAEPDPKEARRQELHSALCELGPSRDDVGSMARQQLALELAKMTIERFMGSAVPCKPYAQAPRGQEPPDLRARLSGESQIVDSWRMARNAELRAAIPGECKISVVLNEVCVRGRLTLDSIDGSEWAIEMRRQQQSNGEC